MLPEGPDEETQKDLDWILARVDHVLMARRQWDIEKIEVRRTEENERTYRALGEFV